MSENKFVWYKKARVINVEEFHPPFSPKLEVDPKLLAEKIKEIGADVIHIAAASKHAIYPAKHYPVHPELKGRDLFGEIVSECKKRGLKVIAYVPACHKLPYDLLKKQHPEWIWKPAPRGEPADSYHYALLKKYHPAANWIWKSTPDGVLSLSYHSSEGLHAPLCWNSPYREAFREMVREIVSGYPLDGIYLDSWQRIYFAPFEICYCNKCQRDFKGRYGFELPVRSKKLSFQKEQAIEDWFSYYKNLSWEIAGETVALVRKLKKDMLIFCHGEEPYSLRDHLMDHDGFLMEEYEPLSFRLQYVSLMVNEERICTPFIGRCDHLQRLLTYGKEFFLEGISTVASGGVPVVANGHSYYFAGRKDTQSLRKLFGVMKDMEKELETSEPYPFIAIPTPRFIMSFFREAAERKVTMGNGQTSSYEKEMIDSVKNQLEGAFRIGLSCHLPVQTVPECLLSDIEKLKKYKILYLPGTPVLSEDEVKTIDRYIKEGGNLLVSGFASLIGKNGNFLRNFALNEILGVNLRLANSKEKAILENLRFKNGCFTDIYLKFKGSKGCNYFPLHEPMPQEIRKRFLFLNPQAKTEVLANLVLGNGKIFSPGITLHRYGKGKAIYLCSGFEERYLRQRSPMERDLFKNLFFCLVEGKVPFQVNLPDTVFTLLNRYKNGWLLHLINYTGCIHEKPFPFLWPYDLPRIEWIPKITNIKIAFNLKKETKIREAKMIPARKSLRFNYSRGILSLCLPELNDYCGISLEFE